MEAMEETMDLAEEEAPMKESLAEEFGLLKSVDMTVQEKNYVFDIVTNRESVLAASFSNHTIKILDPETLTSKHSWRAHSKQITGLKFSPENHCHLFSSSLDGSICLWDIRQPSKKASKKAFRCFRDLSSNRPKPLSCFDINCTGRFLCGGTELIQKEAYIIFWDIRSTKMLGGYWDSHTDIITQLKFHPSKKDSLISGSTDGLINLFDVSKRTEADALISTLNTESSICKLNWIPDSKNKLYCITHTHDLKVWNAFEPSPCISITRDDFRNKADVKAPIDYLVDILRFTPPKFQLMSGSFNGVSCIWDISDESFSVRSILPKGHSDVVRTCRWNEKTKTVITGGEDGIISVWKDTEEPNLPSESEKAETMITGGEDGVVSGQKEIEEPSLASESEKVETMITGGEDGIVSIQKEEIEESSLASESEKIKTMIICDDDDGIVSVWKKEIEEPNLASESEKTKTVITGGEDGVVPVWKKDVEEPNLASESEQTKTMTIDVVDGVESVWKETEQPNVESESKKISPTVTHRDSRKFRPY